MSGIKSIARFTAWAGLTAAGALHAAWASGSHWPAKNRKQLGEMVVGSGKAMPDRETSRAVAAGAFVGAAVVAGGLGEGRVVVGLRRLIGAALLARAALGGEATLELLELPKPGKRFRALDERYYRPLFAVLGAAALIGARKPRREAGAEIE